MRGVIVLFRLLSVACWPGWSRVWMSQVGFPLGDRLRGNGKWLKTARPEGVLSGRAVSLDYDQEPVPPPVPSTVETLPDWKLPRKLLCESKKFRFV